MIALFMQRSIMVLTSHDQLGDTGLKTGFWLEEGAAPYFVFRDAGEELTLASPKGSQPPPGMLRHVKYKGEPLVKRKQVTGFTNGEEEEMKLTHVVPFLVEDELLRLGAIFEKKADWQPFTITDGRLTTGQNPALSTITAQALLNFLAAEKAAKIPIEARPLA